MRGQVFSLVLLAFSLTACAGGADSAAIAAQHGTLSTRIVALRATATYQADRRLLTLEALATESTRVAARQRQIIVTLEGLGQPPVDLAAITPAQTATPAVTLIVEDGAPAAEQGPTGGITRLPPTPDALALTRQATPTPAPITPTIAPTRDPDAPYLTNALTAPEVGADDCALSPTDSFSTASPRIYVVARAYQLSAGNRVESRWYRGDEQLVSYDFQPDFDIDDACIWFFVEGSDFAFTPGSDYRVELWVNAGLALPALTFSITAAGT